MHSLDRLKDCYSPVFRGGEIQPCDPYEVRITSSSEDSLNDDVVALVIDRNRLWLESTPRTSKEILRILFPFLDCPGTLLPDLLLQIGRVMFDAGFSPDDSQVENPAWTIGGDNNPQEIHNSNNLVTEASSTSMTTPLFIRSERGGVIYISIKVIPRDTSHSINEGSWNMQGEYHDHV